ncbi:MAG: hypothetical protein JRJ84_07800, partial [Deltaproteobacteria bacterium]|nr:hypothetical protein [Deltaproteobacteria bacterium]
MSYHGSQNPVPGRIGRTVAIAATTLLLSLTACKGDDVESFFALSATVSGLAGTGLVLQNNGGDDLPISADGSSSFGTQLADGASYDVTVLTQPSGPSQSCAVENGIGNIDGADATVTVSCVTDTFTVGGSVTGLAGTGLQLQNNGGNDLDVTTDGAFTFTTALDDGSSYAVTVKTPPTGPSQSCLVTSGSGTIEGANVTNVAVACTTNSYTVGGTVAGLLGTGLVLQNNGADDEPMASDGGFTFDTPLLDGTLFAVTVLDQPANPDQTCSVANGGGTLAGADVTDVAITCILNVLRVDDDSTAVTPDGRTWATAYPTVQAAIDAASPGWQIWVARGLYTGASANDPVADLGTTLSLYGGFAATEALLGDRPDPTAASTDDERTFLDGDVDGDGNPSLGLSYDQYTGGDANDNSFHVVVAGSDTLIDGVTIRNGVAIDVSPTDPTGGSDVSLDPDFRGAGIYVAIGAVNVTVANSRILDNTAYFSGAAIHMLESNVTLSAVIVQDNEGGGRGGAIKAVDSNLTLSDTEFVGNTAPTRSGAIMFDATDGAPSVPVLDVRDSLFEGNGANTDKAGAIAAGAGTSLLIADSTFKSNTARLGGAIRCHGSATIERTTFDANVASGSGGAIWTSGCALEIRDDSVFSSNSSDGEGGALSLGEGTTATVTDASFLDNGAWSGGSGGAIRISGSTLTITDTSFSDNEADMQGGAIFGENGSTLTLIGATFVENICYGGDGGAIRNGGAGGSVTVTGSSFLWNLAEGSGGALYATNGDVTISKSEFIANEAVTANGGAVSVSKGPAQLGITDCVLADNDAGSKG